MKTTPYDIVICGAGIAGISSAYFLCKKHAIRNILIVDERPPLSLTSDKSTECYRNWWPGPDDAMVRLMNRSIDLLEELATETNNIFHLNRRGYLYVSSGGIPIEEFLKFAQAPSQLGAGPLRIHNNIPDDPIYIPPSSDDFRGCPDGADLFLDSDIILNHYPYLTDETKYALHVRRAGWLSAQQLGMYLFNEVRMNGVDFLQDKIINIETNREKVDSVKLARGDVIHTAHFINAAGPFLRSVGTMLDIDIPIFCELHQKAAFYDHLGAIPREAPLLIYTDPQKLDWSPEERAMLHEDDDTSWLLGELPPGAHTRPDGGFDSQIALMLWEYHTEKVQPVLPPELDPIYPEIALRGLIKILPSLKGYVKKLPRFTLDGGYYTKTIENRPLIGPLPISGSYVIGALSGYGIMAACAAGELLADYVAKYALPEYASAFHIDRYSNKRYQSMLESWTDTGQL